LSLGFLDRYSESTTKPSTCGSKLASRQEVWKGLVDTLGQLRKLTNQSRISEPQTSFSVQNKLSSDLSDGRSRFHAEIMNRRPNNFPPPALSGPKRALLPLSQPPQRSAAPVANAHHRVPNTRALPIHQAGTAIFCLAQHNEPLCGAKRLSCAEGPLGARTVIGCSMFDAWEGEPRIGIIVFRFLS